MSKKKIAILGAALFQEPAISKAQELGLETHVFAWAAGDRGEKMADYFYPISIREKDEILEKHGILKCKKDDFARVSEALVVHGEVSSIGAEALVNDREAAAKLYPDMVMEPATLEQIMIHYVSGKR